MQSLRNLVQTFYKLLALLSQFSIIKKELCIEFSFHNTQNHSNKYSKSGIEGWWFPLSFYIQKTATLLFIKGHEFRLWFNFGI